MRRYGTVIVFKKGVTKKQAEKALAKLEDSGVVEVNEWQDPYTYDTMHTPMVESYDDKYGSGPVWYIP